MKCYAVTKVTELLDRETTLYYDFVKRKFLILNRENGSQITFEENLAKEITEGTVVTFNFTKEEE